MLYAESVWVMLQIRKSRGPNTIILTLHCLLFVACSLHFFMGFAHYVKYLVRCLPATVICKLISF